MQARRVDLIAVVAFFIVTGGIAAPAVHQAGKQNDLDTTINNLKQMALASHNAHDANMKLPQIAGKFGGKDGSLHFHLLPYIEQLPLYNKGSVGVAVAVMQNPGDRSAPDGGVYK